MKWKICLGLIAIFFICSSLFGWHLHTFYRGFVASTDQGKPTFSEATRKAFGQQIEAELTRKNVKFAIISRAGQKRSKLPKGIHFTHSAFWLKNEAGGYDVYNLYHGEKNRRVSSLVVDRPADFLKLTQEKDVGILLPHPDIQARLYDYIGSLSYGKMHQENYSLISNPWDARFQNCNEFMLDTLAAFFWNTYSVEAVKARFKKELKPSEIKTSWLKRLMGPMIDERLIMEDHADKIYTTTRHTLSQFLQSEHALAEDYWLDLTEPENVIAD